MPPHSENGTNGSATERTHLLPNPNGDAADERPNGDVHHPKPWKDDDPRPWVRFPSKVAYTTWMVLASNYVNVFLVFVPLGIIAGASNWSPTLVFVFV